MTKIDNILKKLSELYEFNRKIKAYDLKKKANKRLQRIADKPGSR